MDLKKILSVSGRPGLYQTIGHSPRGIVAESLIDGKRVTLFSHERISTLEDISIFTTEEDISLKAVLKIIFEKLEGQSAISPKSSANELRLFMEKMIPNYDAERVYDSDLKRLVSWYNLLLEKNLIDNQPDEEETQEAENQEEKHTVKEEPKAEKKPKPKPKSPVSRTQKTSTSAAPKPTQRKTSPRAK